MITNSLLMDVYQIIKDLRRKPNSNELKYAQTVALRTYDGHYISTRKEEGNRLKATADQIRRSEIFTLTDVTRLYRRQHTKRVRFGDKIALGAYNKSFVSARLMEGGKVLREPPLLANASRVREWEIFTLVSASLDSQSKCSGIAELGCPFALRASNGKYVRYSRSRGGVLFAASTIIDNPTTFILMDIPQALTPSGN